MDVMLKLNRITLENTEKTHRMEDVSFHFHYTGFNSINVDDESQDCLLVCISLAAVPWFMGKKSWNTLHRRSSAVIAAYALRLYSAIFSCWSSALCWIISA